MNGAVEKRQKVIEHLLQEAAANDDWNMMKFILGKCWNKTTIFEIKNSIGDNILHQTCRENYTRSTRTLIEQGADVNLRNTYGDTGLHIASRNGHEIILFLMMEAGSNPFIENKAGKQAIDVAQNTNVKEILRHYGVRCSEMKLMKNLTKWQQIFEEEEKKRYNGKRKNKTIRNES